VMRTLIGRLHRLLSSPQVPTSVRRKIEQYVEDKIAAGMGIANNAPRGDGPLMLAGEPTVSAFKWRGPDKRADPSPRSPAPCLEARDRPVSPIGGLAFCITRAELVRYA
jgi:hypothetical protein